MNTIIGLALIAAISTILFVVLALLVGGFYLASTIADGESPQGARPHRD